jgi:hypothetical protein
MRFGRITIVVLKKNGGVPKPSFPLGYASVCWLNNILSFNDVLIL